MLVLSHLETVGCFAVPFISQSERAMIERSNTETGKLAVHGTVSPLELPAVLKNGDVICPVLFIFFTPLASSAAMQ